MRFLIQLKRNTIPQLRKGIFVPSQCWDYCHFHEFECESLNYESESESIKTQDHESECEFECHESKFESESTKTEDHESEFEKFENLTGK